MEHWTIEEFSAKLSDKIPVPGGGGVSALAGALGAALGHMAAAFSVGKKQYAQHEPVIRAQMHALAQLRLQLVAGIQQDADAFKPLSVAYALPAAEDSDKREKQKAIQHALDKAVQPPMDAIVHCEDVIECLLKLQPVTSQLVLSDIGCAASLCRACMEAALLNVMINTCSMEDKQKAAALLDSAQRVCQKGVRDCEKLYEAVKLSLCSKN